MKKTSIVVIGIVLIVGMALLTEIILNSQEESTGGNEYSEESFGEWENSSQDSAEGEKEEPQGTVKGIVISGVGTEKKISHPGETVDITISGSYHNITVSKDTKIDHILISGTYNVVRVSREHSFTSDLSGVDTRIVYYD